DYRYIPLGGNRDGFFARYRNLMITMLLGGLWHGAGWNFIIWGGLHGSYLVVNHLFRALRPQGWNLKWIGAGLAWLLTTAAVLLAWVFFRAETLGGPLSLVHSMISPTAHGAPTGIWTESADSGLKRLAITNAIPVL